MIIINIVHNILIAKIFSLFFNFKDRKTVFAIKVTIYKLTILKRFLFIYKNIEYNVTYV